MLCFLKNILHDLNCKKMVEINQIFVDKSVSHRDYYLKELSKDSIDPIKYFDRLVTDAKRCLECHKRYK